MVGLGRKCEACTPSPCLCSSGRPLKAPLHQGVRHPWQCRALAPWDPSAVALILRPGLSTEDAAAERGPACRGCTGDRGTLGSGLTPSRPCWSTYPRGGAFSVLQSLTETDLSSQVAQWLADPQGEGRYCGTCLVEASGTSPPWRGGETYHALI